MRVYGCFLVDSRLIYPIIGHLASIPRKIAPFPFYSILMGNHTSNTKIIPQMGSNKANIGCFRPILPHFNQNMGIWDILWHFSTFPHFVHFRWIYPHLWPISSFMMHFSNIHVSDIMMATFSHISSHLGTSRHINTAFHPFILHFHHLMLIYALPFGLFSAARYLDRVRSTHLSLLLFSISSSFS